MAFTFHNRPAALVMRALNAWARFKRAMVGVWHLHPFTRIGVECDYCHATLSAIARDHREAAREAARRGWDVTHYPENISMKWGAMACAKCKHLDVHRNATRPS